MATDTRIIRLPSRSNTARPVDMTPLPDKYKELAAVALRVDVELASIIDAWARLPRTIKDSMLTLATIRH